MAMRESQKPDAPQVFVQNQAVVEQNLSLPRVEEEIALIRFDEGGKAVLSGDTERNLCAVFRQDGNAQTHDCPLP